MSVTAKIKRGYELLAGRDLQEAARIAKSLLKQGDTPVALALASEVASAAMNHKEAIEHAERAVTLEPDNPARRVLLARTYFAAGRIAEARDLALNLASGAVRHFGNLQIVGTLLVHVEEHEAAYKVFKRAAETAPYRAEGQRNLAMTCRTLGKLDEAEHVADTTLELDPDDSEILLLRSGLRRQTRENNHIADLSGRLAGQPKDWRDRVKTYYALAKELEDIKEYEKAFEAIEAGAELRRRHTRYDANDDVSIFASLQAAFTPDALAAASSGDPTQEPIFILGMPRTGSTLLERIIASHSEVYAAGELGHFASAMMEQAKIGAKDRHSLVQNSLKIDMAKLGQRYLELTRPMTGHTPHFIDKLPLNFLYIGLIHLALPNAKIIHVKRTPMDACFAMYKFHFNQAYPFSYSLNDLATYYQGYHQLMDHWRKLMPGKILDIAYEDIVADTEGSARKLIADLGLSWEDDCLQFHQVKTASLTGSASQVRQPVYRSSVGRWRAYEKQLQPLKEALEKAGIDPLNP